MVLERAGVVGFQKAFSSSVQEDTPQILCPCNSKFLRTFESKAPIVVYLKYCVMYKARYTKYYLMYKAR